MPYTCGAVIVHVACTCTCTCGVPVQAASILSCECNGYYIARRHGQARCGRSLATFLALQAFICQVISCSTINTGCIPLLTYLLTYS